MDIIKFSTLKPFLISLVVVFIGVCLNYLGIRLPTITLFKTEHQKIIEPTVKKIDIFNLIKSKLGQKPNDYQLKNNDSLIQTANAMDNGFKSYAVVDFDSGQILSSKSLNQRLPVASLTKVMTAIVALDLDNPTDLFPVSSLAANQPPTKLGLTPGQKLTLDELLHGLLMTSANDTAKVIQEGIDNKYGQGVFIQAMNLKAQTLELKDTHFTNPAGLDNADNFSSVQDLAVLTHYALTNYPLISSIAKADYQFYPANEYHRQIDLYNWNGLLDVYPGVVGMKIGNTDQAGYTTIAVATRNGKQIIVVGLGAPGVLQRDLWAAELLDQGFQNFGFAPINISETQLRNKYVTWKYWG